MSTQPFEQIRDYWKNVSDWVKGLSDASPKVTLNGTISATKVLFNNQDVAAGQMEQFVEIQKEIRVEELTIVTDSEDAISRVRFWDGSSWVSYVTLGLTTSLRNDRVPAEKALITELDLSGSISAGKRAITMKACNVAGIQVDLENQDENNDLRFQITFVYSEVGE